RENLRGLDRLVHELASFRRAGRVEAADLPAWVRREAAAAMPPPASPPAEARPPVPGAEEFSRVVRELRGNVRALARHFRRDRRQIYRWMEAYGLREGARDNAVSKREEPE